MQISIETINKISLNFFIISIFLQSFSIIKTDGFGIAFSTTLILLIFILNLKKIKISKTEMLLLVFTNIILLFNMIINQEYILIKLLRIDMIIFDIIMTKYFIIKYDYEDIKKYFIRYIFIIIIYGIYCYLADLYNLPKFMNIFINNPSYADYSNDMYRYYGGWSKSARIYTVFYEPSVYAVFMVLCIVFISLISINKRKKISLDFLMLYG